MAGIQSTEIATLDNQTLTSPDGFENAGDADKSKSKGFCLPAGRAKTNAKTGGLVKKRNMTEVEKKARWPPVDNLRPMKLSDKEIIAIARAKKPKDQAGMPLGIWRHTKDPMHLATEVVYSQNTITYVTDERMELLS